MGAVVVESQVPKGTPLRTVLYVEDNPANLELVEEIIARRADLSTAHIPIIALSANAMPHDIKKALAAGFFNYLTKPIKVNQLLEALDVALKFSKTASGRAAKKGTGIQ